MACGRFVVVTFVLLSVSFVLGLPKDILFNNQNEVKDDDVVQTSKLPSPPAVTEVNIPGRVSCQYEEATEDSICQEHCLPKGYSYGICVSMTCSCI